MRKLDRSGGVLAAYGAIELVKDAVFSLPVPLPTLLSRTSAQTLGGTWQKATRIGLVLGGQQPQGTLARPREAKVGTGSSLAKS